MEDMQEPTSEEDRLFEDDVTPAEFEASRRQGLPVRVVTSLAEYVAGVSMPFVARAFTWNRVRPTILEAQERIFVSPAGPRWLLSFRRPASNAESRTPQSP